MNKKIIKKKIKIAKKLFNKKAKQVKRSIKKSLKPRVKKKIVAKKKVAVIKKEETNIEPKIMSEFERGFIAGKESSYDKGNVHGTLAGAGLFVVAFILTVIMKIIGVW